MTTKNKTDKIIVFDLEATCWGDEEPPPGNTQEIIQIGLCELYIKSEEVIRKTSYLVRPKSEISKYCTDLTGITPAMAKSGRPLAEVCNTIKKEFAPKNRVCAAFGIGDVIKMKSECVLKEATYPFGEQFIDVATMFRLKYKLPVNLSLSGSLEHIGLGFLGTKHSADDDAFNTAILLRNIIYAKF